MSTHERKCFPPTNNFWLFPLCPPTFVRTTTSHREKTLKPLLFWVKSVLVVRNAGTSIKMRCLEWGVGLHHEFLWSIWKSWSPRRRLRWVWKSLRGRSCSLGTIQTSTLSHTGRWWDGPDAKVTTTLVILQNTCCSVTSNRFLWSSISR